LKVFLPLTKPEDLEERRLLILDGHESHVTVDFMWECFKNKVQLIYLPAHTSHVLQPLDLAPFSVLKRCYRKVLSKHVHESLRDSTVVRKRLMMDCYYEAREEAFKAEVIRGGWLATGLWPVNISKPLMSRLLLKNTGN